ncbi:uncharacterized protein [Battus philenor]|uniref:uncharacterized protein n=1 Tax=Battus philenor TaxID=42288 RepID=UPI0035CF203F
MCVSVEVTLPTIQTFLLLFSLRLGCIIILIWTTLRTCFGVVFCTSAILEVLLRRSSPPGSWIVSPNKKYYVESNFFVIYYLYVAFIIVEAILVLFTVVHLGWGLYKKRSRILKQYLICRTFTWIVEGVLLLSLCLNHKQLIGWYLVLLLFVILEFYSLITVYSYYVNIIYEQRDPRHYTEKVQHLYNFCTSPKSIEKLRQTTTQVDDGYSYLP